MQPPTVVRFVYAEIALHGLPVLLYDNADFEEVVGVG